MWQPPMATQWREKEKDVYHLVPLLPWITMGPSGSRKEWAHLGSHPYSGLSLTNRFWAAEGRRAERLSGE
ncbi:hypothetical protein AOLI_G00145030 [Acnodon oligacanthus]